MIRSFDFLRIQIPDALIIALKRVWAFLAEALMSVVRYWLGCAIRKMGFNLCRWSRVLTTNFRFLSTDSFIQFLHFRLDAL